MFQPHAQIQGSSSKIFTTVDENESSAFLLEHLDEYTFQLSSKHYSTLSYYQFFNRVVALSIK